MKQKTRKLLDDLMRSVPPPSDEYQHQRQQNRVSDFDKSASLNKLDREAEEAEMELKRAKANLVSATLRRPVPRTTTTMPLTTTTTKMMTMPRKMPGNSGERIATETTPLKAKAPEIPAKTKSGVTKPAERKLSTKVTEARPAARKLSVAETAETGIPKLKILVKKSTSPGNDDKDVEKEKEDEIVYANSERVNAEGGGRSRRNSRSKLIGFI